MLQSWTNDGRDQASPAGIAPPQADVRLRTEVITGIDGVAALRPEYDRLGPAAGHGLPFALHEWHVTWCEYFLRRNPRIIDQPLFHVLRDDAQACVAIVPLIYSQRRVGPLQVGAVDMLGSDPALTEIRGPLIVPGYERQVVQAVHRSLQQSVDWDWIHWSGVRGPLEHALTVEGRLQWRNVQQDFVLDLAPTWEEFRARLKRNIRESLRHGYNSLRRDGHEFEFDVARQAADVEPALDRFFELHALRAGLQGTVPHKNNFASPVSRLFLRAVCGRLAARGAVRVFQLRIRGKVVATRIGFVVGDSLYLYYSGFDPAWARYGVMTTAVAEAIRYAIAQGLKTVNLSPGLDVAKTRWGPRAVEYRSAYRHSERLLSRLSYNTYIEAANGNGLVARILQRVIRARRDWS